MAQIDKGTLERYVQLDKRIHEQESKNTVKALSLKEDQLKDLEQTLSQLQQHYDSCVKATEKEKKDVDQLKQITNVGQMFQSQSAFDQQMTKEQEEYMDALNKQEIAKREVDGVTEQVQEVKSAITKLNEEKKELTKLYEEYDSLLNSIFKGEYGSPQENKLESELDLLIDKKQRIQVAHYKWTNGRQLLAHAFGQLSQGEKKWAEVARVPQSEPKKKYDIATETRNNITAAAQNIRSTHKYLSNITFPYCTTSEIDTLDRAVSHIYTDMLTPDRHSHAANVWTVTRKREAALLQWFDNVIANTIQKDMDKATAETNQAEIALRKERLKLIKERIAEENGTTVVNVAGEMELGKDTKHNEQEAYVSKPDPGNKTMSTETPPGVPLSQLAPPPSQDQIFGEMDSLKKQHEREKVEFEKAQEMNKTRLEQGLQEKLAARRNRRQRQEAHEQQASQIS